MVLGYLLASSLKECQSQTSLFHVTAMLKKKKKKKKKKSAMLQQFVEKNYFNL